MSKLKDIYSITYGVGIIFMKLSFAFYFWNLFSPRPWKSSALKLSVISTGALYLAYTAIAIYCTLPRGPKTSFLEQPEKLSSDHLVFVPDLAAMSVFYDLYILSLLLGGIWKVKIGLKMRYIMSTVFLIRVVYVSHPHISPNWGNANALLGPAYIWSVQQTIDLNR
jgi:hypothetical protein